VLIDVFSKRAAARDLLEAAKEPAE
jgi:hypothetical protein